MKTNVIMKRELFTETISQRSDNGYLSATDLTKAGNKWRAENKINLFMMSNWLQSDNVKLFISELEKETTEKVIISGRGRGVHTWVHPYLFIKMALAINPVLEVKVIGWIFDELIKYRNESGDSYKKMAGALYLSIPNKSLFTKTLIEFAVKIREACGIQKDDEWQSASKEQLALRDKIHENVSLLSDILNDPKNLIEVAIKKAVENK